METAHTLRTHDGVTLAYRASRVAAPRGMLVLLHGLASNLSRWSEFIATTRLAQSWDMVRLDLRGHAGSLCRSRIGMDEWCSDVAAILRAEGAPRALLVGHCLGANVALWFAQRMPQATKGLVLIEPMFREALRGSLATVAALRPALALLVPALRALAALGVHRRRLAFSRLRDDVAVGRLFTELGPRFQKRPGGYLRILKLGFRVGDSAPMAIVQLLDKPATVPEAKAAAEADMADAKASAKKKSKAKKKTKKVAANAE